MLSAVGTGCAARGYRKAEGFRAIPREKITKQIKPMASLIETNGVVCEANLESRSSALFRAVFGRSKLVKLEQFHAPSFEDVRRHFVKLEQFEATIAKTFVDIL